MNNPFRFVSLVLFAGLLAAPPDGLAADLRPNFVFILTDDQGWSQSSMPMHPEIPDSHCDYFETPSHERLAREGMRFTSGYAPAPNCTPTRRSVLCGMTPARQRGTEFPSRFNPAEHLTIPKALKAVDAAYRCAHFGKWGERMVATPQEAGYHESDGPTINRTGGVDGAVVFTAQDDPKLTFSVTRRAMDFMERQTAAEQPFYLQVSYYALHRQIQARPETIEKYDAKGEPPRTFPPQFAAMAEDMDRGIGQLLDKIDDLQIAGRTYVFVAADNGGAEYEREHPAYLKQLGTVGPRRLERAAQAAQPGDKRLPCNSPLRGAKNTLYEGGLRVPFLVRGPGVKAGSWCHEPVVLYDLLPTLVDLAGGAEPLPAEIDGGSFAPLLADGTGKVKRPLDGLVFHRPFSRVPDGGQSVLRSGKYKLILNWADGKPQLYDLEQNIDEQRDLSASRPEDTARLHRMLVDYLAAVNAEQPDEDTIGNPARRQRNR